MAESCQLEAPAQGRYVRFVPYVSDGYGWLYYGDPEQEYFADGIAEDVITALSRSRWLFVVARNSSFTYKAKSVEFAR
jgi:hypothetical protein